MPHSVLIVDDEEDIANLLKECVINLGYEAESFTDPRLAYNHFSADPGRFHLILTDFRMPGLSGIDLANKIREIDITTKIILITAFNISTVINSSRYKIAKINQVLHKPIKLSIVKRLVEENVMSHN